MKKSPCQPAKLLIVPFFLLAVLSCFSQTTEFKYDSLFSLKGYKRNIYLQDIINRLVNKPTELARVLAMVELRGNASDKCQADMVREGLKLPAKDFEGAIRLYEKYLTVAEKLNNHFLQAYTNYLISEHYRKLKQHNKSFEYKLYCLDELKKDPDCNYYEQSWVLHEIAAEYYRFSDYPNTVALCKPAFALQGKNSPNASWFVKVVSNLAGMAYLKNQQFDSAQTWLQKTYYIAVQHNDTIWKGISLGNIGSVYYQQQQYQEAIIKYKQALQLCMATKMWDNAAAFYCQLADCYLQTGKLNEVAPLLEEAVQTNAKMPTQPFNLKYFKVAGDYFRTTGNIALALQYTDSLDYYQKKQTEVFDINKKIKAEAQLAYSNNVLENQVALQEANREKWLLFGIILLLLLLSIIGVLLYKRQRLQYKYMQANMIHEQYKTQEELQQAMNNIREFTTLVQEKNELIDHFMEEIQRLKLQNNTITNEQLKHLEELKQSAVLTEDDWNNFQMLFERVHPGYLRKLKTTYPDLTPAETRYLVFTKLELNSRQMSAMLGVSAEAIRNIRFRIKKKLGLEDGDEIDRLVRKL